MTINGKEYPIIRTNSASNATSPVNETQSPPSDEKEENTD